MKRSEALVLIANQLDLLNGRFHGLRINFSQEELSKADVILTTLESAGMQPPNITLEELVPGGLKADEQHYFACWEPEKKNTQTWDDDRESGAV